MSRPYGQTYIGNEKDIPTRASIKSYLVIRLEFFLHFMLVTILSIALTVKRPTPDVMLDSPSSAIAPAHFFAPTFKESTNTRPKPFFATFASFEMEIFFQLLNVVIQFLL